MHPRLDISESNRLAFLNAPQRGKEGPLPGTRVSRNITLVQLLGVGGMGNVWLADHAGLGTQVAVKFMSKELAADPVLVSRFGREAKLVARIKSPHVVQILDYATTADGIPCIVMELLEGETLENRLERCRALSLEDASTILVQLCKALERAHELGVIHRDIKPDNVFLMEKEGGIFVKVIDFGIARDERVAHGITVSGTTMGTPSYMSPEQLCHPQDVDPRSDLWSIAVVMYRCLTGILPFEGDNFGSMCVSINAGTFTRASFLNSDVPPGLDDWFEKALSQSQDDRFESAITMVDAYLAELDKAHLLPGWAAPRKIEGALARYNTGLAEVSEHPIKLRSRAHRHGNRGAALALIILAGLILIAAARPRSASTILGLVREWNPPSWVLPQLQGSTEEAVAAIDTPRAWVPSSALALAERERERTPTVANKAAHSSRFVEPDLPLLAPAPAQTPYRPAPAPEPLLPPPGPSTPPSTVLYGI